MTSTTSTITSTSYDQARAARLLPGKIIWDVDSPYQSSLPSIAFQRPVLSLPGNVSLYTTPRATPCLGQTFNPASLPGNTYSTYTTMHNLPTTLVRLPQAHTGFPTLVASLRVMSNLEVEVSLVVIGLSTSYIQQIILRIPLHLYARIYGAIRQLPGHPSVSDAVLVASLVARSRIPYETSMSCRTFLLSWELAWSQLLSARRVYMRVCRQLLGHNVEPLTEPQKPQQALWRGIWQLRYTYSNTRAFDPLNNLLGGTLVLHSTVVTAETLHAYGNPIQPSSLLDSPPFIQWPRPHYHSPCLQNGGRTLF